VVRPQASIAIRPININPIPANAFQASRSPNTTIPSNIALKGFKLFKAPIMRNALHKPCWISYSGPSCDFQIWQNPSIPLGVSEKEGFDWMGSREIGIKSIHVSNAYSTEGDVRQ
jgi:hypothetical protein